LIVSTDDEEIAKVSKARGAEIPFIRPSELAQDDTPGIDPVLHAIGLLPEYDYIVLLQPTSPLRSVEDIDACLERCIEQKSNSCVSVVLSEKSPYWMYSLENSGVLQPVIVSEKPILRRQEAPEVFVLNGAVYVAKTAWLTKTRSFLHEETVGYVMPKERSIDVDNTLDFLILETIISQNKEV